ncbi:MAG: endonuclease/exonuclease/phosphatase family protein [Burkholderiales bacterium]|jgi:endonuclease/exonuclease/phosphatase family metal-dependent hydrolase|nr:endonuclease/exonuclease/phosphatase family protein [Burkholderiales bacterium]
MTAILTWNIQCGLGCDGVVDLARIARLARSMGEADVLCLQEVARNDPAIAGGADQVAELQALFPDHQAFFGAGLSRRAAGRARREFGNLLLSRLPVLQLFCHLLPQPAAGGIKHMQRQAIEAVVDTPAGPLRVVTTHLEYYSAAHRAVQIGRLRALQDEAAANAHDPPKAAASPYDPVPRPAALVLCGDLNVQPQEDEYRQLFAPPLLDAWRVARGDEPHPPSTGLFDRRQWPMGGHCRDYFAVTAEVARRVESLQIELATDASDHQPLLLTLRD